MYIKSKNTLLFAITLSGIAGNIGAQPFVADSEYFASRALGIINAEAAYSLGYTGRGVTVGVLDSGIEFRHPEFADRIAFTFDIPRGGVSLDGDYDLHGTGVSGLIAAARNGRGLQGVAFGSTVAVFGSDLFSGNIEGTIVDVAELAVDQFAVVTSVAASRGVRILNNSWGFDDTPVVPAVRRFDSPNIDEETGLPVFAAGDLVTGPETEEEQELATFYTSNLANSAANFINQPGGGIIVFSASNDSMTQSAIEGGLPYFEDYTALLKGSFINVVAVGPDGETLTAYSNEAGLARSWTLAAPGGGDDEGNDGLISVGLLDDDGRPTAQIASGTSFAAPLVSGAAALVWEAFPWMTARQVTQTLLTSAVDLGAPGIDDVFGWGRLDVGAAVLGPAYFGPGEILHGVPDFAPTFIAAIPAGRSAVFGNDISGPGGLAKNGLGILELTGDNTFTGDTLVEAGALVVNGTLSSSVWIQAAGLLGGSGEIGGQVTSSGLVSPGNSIGTLTIAGDFTATADSTLVIEIAADGTSDRLVVGGQALIEGAGLAVLPISSPADYARSVRYSSVLTAGSLAGSGFGSVSIPGYSQINTELLINGLALDLDFTITPNAAPLARTRNQRAVATVLAAADAPGSTLEPLTLGLAFTPDLDVPEALDTLSGELHAASLGSFSRQTGSFRNATMTADSKTWFAPLRQSTRLDADGGFRSLRDDQVGGSAGAGIAGDFGSAGVAFGYIDGTQKLGGVPDRTEQAAYMLAAYATKQTETLRLSGTVGHAYADAESRRTTTLSGETRIAEADYTANTSFADARVAWTAWQGQTSQVAPLAGLSLEHTTREGFTETGAGDRNLRVASETMRSVKSEMGVEWSANLNPAERFLTIAPSLRVLWRHEFADTGGGARAGFATASAAGQFTVNSSEPQRDSLLVAPSLNMAYGDAWRAQLGYEREQNAQLKQDSFWLRIGYDF